MSASEAKHLASTKTFWVGMVAVFGALVGAAFGNGETFVGIGAMLTNLITEPNLMVGLAAITGRHAIHKGTGK